MALALPRKMGVRADFECQSPCPNSLCQPGAAGLTFDRSTFTNEYVNPIEELQT